MFPHLLHLVHLYSRDELNNLHIKMILLSHDLLENNLLNDRVGGKRTQAFENKCIRKMTRIPWTKNDALSRFTTWQMPEV